MQVRVISCSIGAQVGKILAIGRRSSEVEQGTHKPWVAGSIPAAGTLMLVLQA